MSDKKTVGEMQGEDQHPPESLRIGKECVLLDPMVALFTFVPHGDKDYFDETAQKFVHYL